MPDYPPQYDQLIQKLEQSTAAIEAQTTAIQENTTAIRELTQLERARDNLLAEQNALLAMCAKLIIASMDDTSPSGAIREAITSMSNFGYKSEYFEHFFRR